METLKWIGFGIGLCAASMLTGCGPSNEKPSIHFENAYFYDAHGKFLPEKAKDALIALMKYHGYPVFPGLREKLWVSDYGVGQYAKAGLGAAIFVNNTNDHYMLLDIYLLPNQMLPDHWHESGGKLPPKMEGWMIRHGLSHVVGEGEPNLGNDIVIPPCHANGTVTVKHEVIARPGDFVPLNRPTAHHWQLAGPEGVIMSEVANGHENEMVRHFDKVMNDNFLNAK